MKPFFLPLAVRFPVEQLAVANIGTFSLSCSCSVLRYAVNKPWGIKTTFNRRSFSCRSSPKSSVKSLTIMSSRRCGGNFCYMNSVFFDLKVGQGGTRRYQLSALENVDWRNCAMSHQYQLLADMGEILEKYTQGK